MSVIPRLFQSVQNYLTFPWLENAFPFFKVFQSEWETMTVGIQQNAQLRKEKSTRSVVLFVAEN